MKWIRDNGFALLLFAAVLVLMLYGFQDAARSSSEESLRMTEDALRRAVMLWKAAIRPMWIIYVSSTGCS